ncbi:hypothetical protein [Paenibacillus alba]|uniref:Uncharacterized protein n=1 Tax=Paenibacillus alba TaxID=1197127 RepID=A0ABU6G641_9BACL|nr:hypothetical protein [Paenibacillus alba]MEC0229411.1 hypothetical protein [Paenibacillus alba]
MILGISVFAISVLVAYFEIPKLRNCGTKGNVSVYLIFLAIGNFLVIWRTLGLPFLNPGDWIEFAMRPLTKLLLSLGFIKV